MYDMKQGRKLALRLSVLLAVVLVVVAIGVVGFATEAEPADGPVCYQHGDVNGDGTVDSRDAIYTLYNVLLGEEEYPAEQDLDFNGDAHMDSRDAIYVLYAYMNEEDPDYAYKLNGLVHNYFDPVWKWEGTAATVTLKCGCGETTTLTTGSGVTVTEGEKLAATCVAAGYTTYQATVDGMDYADTQKITVPAGTGHSMVGTQDCENGSHCALCDYALEPLGHQWKADASLSVAATCTTKGVQGYRCEACQQTKTVEQEGSVGHKYAYMEGQDLEKGNCLFVKQYRCAVCQDVIEGTASSDSYSVHSYKATLTKEATCRQQGEKTYACVNGCGHSYTEAVAVNDSHTWDDGVQGDGVKVYTCTGCGETKTTVSVTAETAVSKEQLGAELQLENNAAMTVDQSVVENLDAQREIKISVEAMKVDELETGKTLSDAEKAQIGDNVVYDFNMVYADNNDKVEFQGEITVSLPYTLLPGDDIDSIDVWFIADDGTLEQVNGTYSNGFVTFTTNHFSYYTVTRLTAAQRCARYGHIPVETSKQATCTEDGYTMSVCQRCAAELTKEVYKMSGHSFQTVVTEATCVADGKSVQTCSSCNHTVTEILPALGHNLQADTQQAVAASCTTAGKEVFACTRNSCQYIREDAKPQLAHAYAAFEEKAADCSNKGYKTEKCGLCGDVKTVEETAPLGHSFEESGAAWSWSADNGSATLVLTCANDKTHTKTLSAVVTEKVTASTCTGDGAVTYTAEASYNNKVFADQKVITSNAPGHMIGTAWDSNDAQHYHICTVCEEKVDAAAHNWNSGTVTKAPTCDKSGIKVVKCTVCNYSKEQTIPATGEHTFVNGVCSVCKFAEGSCEHLILKEKEVDLSEAGICEGTVIMNYSCDCGEVSYYETEKMTCKLGEGKQVSITAPNGATMSAREYECSQCGMVAWDGEYRDGKNDPCVGAYHGWFKLTIGGKTILESDQIMMEQEHLGFKQVGVVDLTEEKYGLCSEKLEILECACGKNRQYNVVSSCDWTWDDSYNGKWGRNICVECGATREQRYETEPADGCAIKEISTLIYEKDGVELYRCTNNYVYYDHDYYILGYEMMGESCEDGVLYQQSCADCGDINKDYTKYHSTLLKQDIDLSNSDICYDGLVQRYCFCDEKYQYYEYKGETTCNWSHEEYEHETGADVYVCTECGATQTVTYDESEKDENCQYMLTKTVQFADKNGKLLATVCDYDAREDHDMSESGILLGETCNDGIEVTACCQDCGYSYTYTSEGHETLDLQTYLLEDYGMCGGEVVVRGCLCGYDVGSDSYNTECQWRYYDETENGSIFKCANCEAQRLITYEYKETENPCIKEEKVTFVYSRGNEELLRFSYSANANFHKYVYELELLPGAIDCEQGFTVERVCTVCGDQESWTEHGCCTYPIKQEIVGEGVMCSAAILTQYSCACGQHSGTELEWIDYNNACSYNEYYDDALGCWVLECDKCGVSRTNTYSESPSEDHPCQYTCVRSYTYSKDGEEVFSYEETGYSSRHLDETHFQMLGDTCNDGYYVSWSCARCGESDSSDEIYYGCENYVLDVQEVYNGEELCGPVYVEHIGCACGNLEKYDCGYSCSFSSYGYDSQLGAHMLKCRKCGALQTNSWNSREVEGSCDSNESMYYAFYRDGVLLVEFDRQWVEKSHKLIYTFSLYGETCEDGYDAAYHCIYCDYAGTETEIYGHSTESVQYYNLKGYGLCEGYIEERSCACGYYSYEDCNIYCDWNSTGRVDEATGAEEYYCEECDTYWYYGYQQTRDTENCRKLRNYYYKWTRDGETLLEVTIDTSDEGHNYQFSNVVLTDPEQGCDGGYEVTLTCADCGRTESEWGNSHTYYPYETWYLGEHGCCGGALYLSKCPCGKYADIDCDWECSMSYDSDETGDSYNGSGWYTGTCSECGMVYREESSWTVPENSCIGVQTFKTTITNANGEVLEWNWHTVYEAHSYRMVGADLEDPERGCEGGYKAYMQCQYCDDSYTNSGSSNHEYYLVEQLDLEEMGACGGTLSVKRCPCGLMSRVSHYWDCEMDGYGDGDGDELSGYSEDVYDCKECGLHVVDREDWTRAEGSCVENYQQTVTATLGDRTETLCGARKTWDHTYKVTDFNLYNPEEGCEGGYDYTQECVRCGDTLTSTSSWNGTRLVEYIELSEFGGCGGAIEIHACACGDYAEISYSNRCNLSYEHDSTGTDRNGTDTTIRTCSVCGLKTIVKESWSVADDTCEGINVITVTVMKGSKTESYSVQERYVVHDWKNTYTLAPGSETCEDGVISHAECRLCDAESTGTIDWHEQVTVETFDLAQYGSVCGGKLERQICVCGQKQSMQFRDMLCDLNGGYSIDVWVENILTGGQYTTEGWIYLDTYANMFKCAVTDPKCSLVVRNANYWVKEGCSAVEYQIWQLGYNESTGTCMKEIKIPTGRKYAYHAYEETDIDATENGLHVTGSRYVCPDCGSSYQEKDWRDSNNNSLKFEREGINTLSNGENQYWYEVEEYFVKVVNGNTYRYETMDRYEVVYADGEEYWYQSVYSYNLENTCIRTENYTNSNGYTSIHEGTCHRTESDWVYLREPSCSQTGLRHWTYTCQVCEQVTEEYDQLLQPYDHAFYWDSWREAYCCGRCTMENANGSSGAIIMEDLSTLDAYVVGYCNQTGLEFNPYVSVILYNVGEDENDELVLNFNGYEYLTVEDDGVCGIAYNREAVHMYTAQAIAEANYTGDYAVRISFVPINGSDTLDYAVTFYTQTAN